MRAKIMKIQQGKLKMYAPSQLVPGLLMLGLLALGPGATYAADTVKGSSLYSMHCASCHGASGISVTSGTPNITQSGSMLRSDAMLLRAIKDGKKAMPGYMGILSDREILDVIAHMRTFN